MHPLYEAVEEAIIDLAGDRAVFSAEPIHIQLWVNSNRSMKAELNDVLAALRELHRAEHIRLGGGPQAGEVTIQLLVHAASRPRRDGTNVVVHGGNVQVGDHNRQTVTYGSVMQTLIEKIEQSTLPEKEKTDLKAHLFAVLRHPLTQTLINGAVAFSTGGP